MFTLQASANTYQVLSPSDDVCSVQSEHLLLPNKGGTNREDRDHFQDDEPRRKEEARANQTSHEPQRFPSLPAESANHHSQGTHKGPRQQDSDSRILIYPTQASQRSSLRGNRCTQFSSQLRGQALLEVQTSYHGTQQSYRLCPYPISDVISTNYFQRLRRGKFHWTLQPNSYRPRLELSKVYPYHCVRLPFQEGPQLFQRTNEGALCQGRQASFRGEERISYRRGGRRYQAYRKTCYLFGVGGCPLGGSMRGKDGVGWARR